VEKTEEIKERKKMT